MHCYTYLYLNSITCLQCKKKGILEEEFPVAMIWWQWRGKIDYEEVAKTLHTLILPKRIRELGLTLAQMHFCDDSILCSDAVLQNNWSIKM